MKEEYNSSKSKQGAIDPIPSGKTRITTYLDDDIVEWFRSQVYAAGSGNYQLLINDALREHIQYRQEMSEAEDKINKELDNVFEKLDNIAPIEVRISKRASLQDTRKTEILSIWQKLSLNGIVASTFALLVATVLLGYFKAEIYAYLTLLFMFLLTFFEVVNMWSTITKKREDSKKINWKAVKQFRQDPESEQKLVGKLIRLSHFTLKLAKLKLEFSLKKLQASDKTMGSFLYFLIILVVLAFISGSGLTLQQLEGKSLYGIFKGVPGIIVALDLITKYLYGSNVESKIDNYNRCIFILEKAQLMANNVEDNKNATKSK